MRVLPMHCVSACLRAKGRSARRGIVIAGRSLWKTVRGRGRWFEGGTAEARRGRTVAPRKPRALGR
eukprot:2039474-Prymnesium_polylepis.1